MKRRLGVLLCGCGAFDGTDPAEALLLVAAIQKAGHEPVLLTPVGRQFHVVDHLSGIESEGDTREISQESARIYRGKYHLIQDISPKLLDALFIPGGQGSMKNLFDGNAVWGDSEPLPEIRTFLEEVHRHGGGIGAVSLAEFLVTRIFGPFADGRSCLELGPDEVLCDSERRLFLTPGHLSAQSLPELQKGMEALVTAVVSVLV